MNQFATFGETYVREAAELLVEVEDCILDIEADPNDTDTIDRLFRAMHTIKGSGAMFGFDKIADFTHHVETVLDMVREGKLTISKKLINLILSSRDLISTMLEEFQGGQEVSRKEVKEVIRGLQDLQPRKGRSKPAEKDELEPVPKPSASKTIFRIRFAPKKEIFKFGVDPALLLDELQELGECDIVMRQDNIPTLEKLIPENCYVFWDIILTTKEDENTIRDVFIFVEDDCTLDIGEILSEEDPHVPKLGEILLSRGDTEQKSLDKALEQQKKIGTILEKSGKVSSEQIKSALVEQNVIKKRKTNLTQDTVRVPSEKLDELINLVGELVITQAQLAQVATKVNQNDLSSSVEEVNRLTGNLRDIALNIRMMPIGSTFSRFRRLVRDLSGSLDKKVKLVTKGAETEMDKLVIERLADPLVHIIRNSMDHGIEPPEVRKLHGKPAEGTIELSAVHRGASVVVSIEDDGKGLDPKVIKAKAVEKGMIYPDTDLSDKETLALIMAPGFSTAQQISSVSGRGVGMDVVKKEIEALRGKVEIDSKPGFGTTLNLSLPLTLAIIDGLLIKIADQIFVIPLTVIEECLELTNNFRTMTQTRNVLKLRGELIPFIRLREVFKFPPGNPDRVEKAAIVNSGDMRVGIVVDDILGGHQTVIKSLGRIYRNVEGFSGATILGNGQVALILDVPNLVRVANTEEKDSLEKIRSIG